MQREVQTDDEGRIIQIIIRGHNEEHLSKKRKLYERSWGCEFPGGCDVTDIKKLTIDHFTPRCVARTLGWRHSAVNSIANLQLLCAEHHRMKDESTPRRYFAVLLQLSGGEISMEEFRNSEQLTSAGEEDKITQSNI